jgi:HPt (histidine-containing phosphotransfer) domain-containing protein
MIDSCSINLEDLISYIGIDKDTVIELLGIYCCEMSEEMQKIEGFLENQDWSGLQRTIHNVKGVSANLYLQDMFQAAEVIDLKLKKNDYNDIENFIKNLLDTFDETLKSIHIISERQSINS